MNKYTLVATITVSIGLGATSQAQALTFQPVDFSSSFNYRLQDINSAFPSGNTTLGTVPFTIPTVISGNNNIWHSNVGASTGTKTLNINVGVFGVSEVNTLINTFWGQNGPNSYASLEFFGSDGAYFKKDLVGNVDIRDLLNNTWTNGINGTTTTQVFTQGSVRLDKQQIILPTTFLDETLTTIRLTDTGASNFQRTFLSGVTVGAVDAPPATTPEPSLMIGLMTVGLGLLSSRKTIN